MAFVFVYPEPVPTHKAEVKAAASRHARYSMSLQNLWISRKWRLSGGVESGVEVWDKRPLHFPLDADNTYYFK